MDDRDWLAEQFEHHRPHMRAVAYRMLGSVVETDDAVQEAWLRLSRTETAAVTNLGGWLTTVVGRVCLDMLRARDVRPQPSVTGSLPEPVVTEADSADPAHEAILADSVGLALMVVLDTLTPAERLAFVLHDTFAVPFEQIAPIVGRTPAAARQLASRARRRVRGSVPESEPDMARQREVVDAFLAAARAGDFAALLRVLDPGVVFRLDMGRLAGAAAPLTTVTGAESVAETVLAQGAPFAPLARPAIVNGAAGALVRAGGRLLAVAGFTVRDGLIVELDLLADPDKLARLRVEG